MNFILNFSIKDKNIKLFTFLVEYFENCKIRDFDKFNLVYNAWEVGILSILVRMGANVNEGNVIGSSAINVACFDGDVAMFDKLIELGAEIEYKDKYDWTPLHCACAYGNFNIVTKLIELRANIHCKDIYGNNPLNLDCYKFRYCE